jgi:hypothetical protein
MRRIALLISASALTTNLGYHFKVLLMPLLQKRNGASQRRSIPDSMLTRVIQYYNFYVSQVYRLKYVPDIDWLEIPFLMDEPFSMQLIEQQ